MTNQTGRQVIAIDQTTTPPLPGVQTVLFTFPNGQFPEDATVGPDNRLYVTLPNIGRIVRMNLDGSGVQDVVASGGLGSPSGPRFSAVGNLFVIATGGVTSGVWMISASDLNNLPAAPTPIRVIPGSFGNAGLAFAPNGDLYIADRINNRVLRATWNAPAPFYPGQPPTLAPPTPISISGATIGTPVGIAVNSVGHLFIANRTGDGGGTIIRCIVAPDATASCTTFATFGTVDLPNYLEIVADPASTGLDDLVFVGTSDAANQNGKAWRLNATKLPPNPPTPPITPSTPLAVLPKVPGSGTPPPAVGVANPPFSRTRTKTVTNASVVDTFFDYQYGTYMFEAENEMVGTCTLAITATQTPVNDPDLLFAKTALQNQGTSLVNFLPMDGQQGFQTVFSGEPACTGAGFAAKSGIYFAGLYQTSKYVPNVPNPIVPINPGLVRIHDNPSPAPPDVSLLDPLGFYPLGPPVEGFPDAGTKGGSTGFSKFLLADVALTENDNFCGFSSPANPAQTIQQASNNTFNAGKSIVFQFQASTGPNCTGTLVTDLHAVLAIARILNASGAPDFKRVQISAEGNSVDFPPVFKSVGGKWKITADSGTWGTGTFAATVQANKFYPQTIFFVMR